MAIYGGGGGKQYEDSLAKWYTRLSPVRSWVRFSVGSSQWTRAWSSLEMSTSQRSAESCRFPLGTPVFSHREPKVDRVGWVIRAHTNGICCCGHPKLVAKLIII